MATSTYNTILEIIDGTNPEVTVGGVNSIGEFSFGEAEEIDVTRLNETSGYKRFIAGLKDAGALTVGGFKEATDAGQAKVIELHGSGKVVKWRITYPDGAKAEFNGFVKKFAFGEMAISAALIWSVTVRISGGVTFAEATGA
jgi:predicted secreted protein